MVYNQGAFVPNVKSVKLFKLIQEKLKNTYQQKEQVFVCLTHFTGNLPNPVEMGQIDYCIKNVNRRILQLGGIEVKNTDIFIGGHSLGGALSGSPAINFKFARVLLHAAFWIQTLKNFQFL